MDADVHYRAASVKAQKIPFKEVNWRIRLDHGVMTIDPLSFVMPEGRVAAHLRIDARHDVPDVTLDGRLSAVDLSQFHARNAAPLLEGLLLGRLAVHGRGRSVHAVAASADGTLTTVVPPGQIRSAFAELTGINVARGSLRKPVITLDTTHVLKQGAIAAALAAISPLAAVLAFVDPGLAKDADCGALLAEAQKEGVPVGAKSGARK